MLVIELDGMIHKWKWKKDYLREQQITKYGYTIIRFKNREALYHTHHVLHEIRRSLSLRGGRRLG